MITHRSDFPVDTSYKIPIVYHPYKIEWARTWWYANNIIEFSPHLDRVPIFCSKSNLESALLGRRDFIIYLIDTPIYHLPLETQARLVYSKAKVIECAWRLDNE